MPYCRKCGAELSEEARFCPSCGTPVLEPERRLVTERRGMSGVRIILLVFGGIILLSAFGLLIGGIVLHGVNTSLTDREGFISSRSQRLGTASYAIVFQHINIQMGEVAGDWGIWRPSPRDFVTLRLVVSSNNPSKNIFIGVAKESEAKAYLSDVQYDEVTRFRISPSRIDLEFTTHTGNRAPASPSTQTFWTASRHGAGTQTLEWQPETGSYWIVLMNEDGSAGVDFTVSVGARIPLLSTIGLALSAGGVVALMVGGVMVYFGLRR